MSRPLPIVAVQAPPVYATDDVGFFSEQARRLLGTFPQTRFMIFPELHLHAGSGGRPGSPDQLRDQAQPLDGPRVAELGRLAAELGIWLLPGSLCESDGAGGFYNTAVVFSPAGELAAAYRKCFPWRPYEVATPGDRFVVFDIDGVGRIGLAICYDIWFPEVARQLAGMGAEFIVIPTQTTTCDREQELILNRAAAITNQVFVLSVNAAAPVGTGRSLVVDPEGRVRTQAGDAEAVLTDVVDLDEVTRVRRFGTAGLTRPWSQFIENDVPLELPLYSGRIDPACWRAGDAG
jgi:predicted amidohydrolase